MEGLEGFQALGFWEGFWGLRVFGGPGPGPRAAQEKQHTPEVGTLTIQQWLLEHAFKGPAVLSGSVCMCVCICIYIYICVSMYVYVYVHAHFRVYMFMYTSMYRSTCLCNVYMYMYIHTCARTYVHRHHMCVCKLFPFF